MAGDDSSRNILKSLRVPHEAELRLRGALGIVAQAPSRADPSCKGLTWESELHEDAAGVLSFCNTLLQDIADGFSNLGIDIQSEQVDGSPVLIIDRDICVSFCDETRQFILYLVTEKSELVVRTKYASELRSVLDEMVQSRIPELFGIS